MKGRHAHRSLDCVTGFQASVGRRDLDRTLGTSLNLEANLELLTAFKGSTGVFEVHMCIITGGWIEEPEDGDGVPRCGEVWLCFTPGQYHLPSGTTL